MSFKINNPTAVERLRMNNIQVGEILIFTVEINDSEDLPNTTYELKPVSSSAEGFKKHQNNSIDYNFNTAEYFKTDGDKNGFIDKIILTKKTDKFGVKILKAGSFLNVYQIQKLVDGKAVGNPVKQDLLFSAVKITAETAYTRTRAGEWYQSSRWRREYYFRIFCGDEDFDNYTLPTATIKKISYECNYMGSKTGGILSGSNNDKNIMREKDETEGGPFECGYNLESVKIFIEYTNGERNVIEYNNIKITESEF